MKRKLFSAILFGALLTASTSGLTSCKDYDDDISNLQGQIDKLATAEQLNNKVSEMQSAIAAAKSDAEAKAAAAQTVADAAKAAAADAAAAAAKAQGGADAAAKAAAAAQTVAEAAQKAVADLEAKAATKAELEAAKTAMTSIVEGIQKDHATDKAAIEKSISDTKAALEAQIKANTEALGKLDGRLAEVEKKLKAIEEGEGEISLESLKLEIEAIDKELKDIIGAYSTMITDIQIYGTNGEHGFNDKLTFIQTTEVASYDWNVFGDKEKFSFVKGNQYLGGDSILVRVSPVDAVLTKENVCLVNSQGVDISSIVEVEEVNKYNRLLTGRVRSSAETGLWVVKFRAKNVGEDFYNAAVDNTQGYERSILYAVAAKNSNANVSAGRTVTSEYNLSLYSQLASHGWDFLVNEKNVSYIHNRYQYCEDGTPTNNKIGSPKTYQPELVWLEPHRPYANVVTEDGPNKNAADRYNWYDNRQGQKFLEIEKGKPITIDFGVNGDENIKGFYVTLDERFALESTPSEINAWTSYEYQNVGYTKADGTVVPATLFKGNVGTIVVKDMNNVAGDIIGFRVYAVNYDGTLSDPDGRAFYVAVGDVKTTAEIAQANVEYQEFNNALAFVSDYVDVDGAFDVVFDGAGAWVSTAKDDDNRNLTFDVKYYDADKKEIAASDIADENIGRGNIKYVRYLLNVPGIYIDDAVYKQSITLYKNLTGTIATTDVRTVNVSIKKVMPLGPKFAMMPAQDKYQWVLPVSYVGGINDYTLDRAGRDPKNGWIVLNNFLVSEKNQYSAGDQALKTEDGSYKFTIADATYVNAPAPKNYIVDDAIVEETGGYRNQQYGLSVFNWPSREADKVNLIDNVTEHNITAYYVYNGISKRIETKGNGVREYVSYLDFNAPAQSTEKVVFCSWTKEFTPWVDDTKTVCWNTKYQKNTLTWEETPTAAKTLDLNDVKSTISGRIIPSVKPSPTTLGGLITNEFLAVLDSEIKNLTVKAWFEKDGTINPYFKVTDVNTTTGIITIKQSNQNTQPPIEHVENLKLRVADCFGNVVEVTLPVKVK